MTARLFIKKLNRPFVRFALAGFVNTGVDWAVYYAVSRLMGRELETVAKAIAVVCGITSAYVLNSLWVFRDRFLSQFRSRVGAQAKALYAAQSYIKLFLTYAFGMAANVLTFAGLRRLGLWELLCLAVATGLSLCINFFLLNRFVYRGGRGRES